MKPSTLFTTTSLACLLTGLGLVACGGAEIEPAEPAQTAGLSQSDANPRPASEATRPEAAKHRGRHEGRGKHGLRSPEKMIEKLDANKNGTLEAGELPPRLQERFGEIDTNRDGAVGKDELAAHFKAKFAERAKAKFESKDTNKDGALDQSEIGSERWARLSAADQNGDQKLTPEELRAAFEAGKIKLHGKHGKHGKQGKLRGPGSGEAPAAPAQ